MNAVIAPAAAVLTELQDLATKLASANDAAIASDVALESARSESFKAWQTQRDLARQLHAQMIASAVEPAAFALGTYSFTPDVDSGSFTLKALPPALATITGAP